MQAKVILENGKVKSEYNVLFTFENENDETIIVYTDNKETSKGLTYAYIGKIKDDLVINELTDKEIEIANRILDKIKEEEMKKEQIMKRIILLILIFILCLIFERGYMKDTQEGIVKMYNDTYLYQLNPSMK